MTTNSHAHLQSAKPLSRNATANLRAPGWFAQWPALGLTMIILGTIVFGFLAYGVSTQGQVVQWDQAVNQMLQANVKRIPPSLMEYAVFGFYVGRELILIMAAMLGIYFWRKHFWRELMMIMWGPGLGGLLWYALSLHFNRPRPSTQLDLVQVSVPSFPSGHAVSSVLFYGLLAYLLVPKMPSRLWKWLLVIFLTLIPLLVGLSRLLVGGHYLSDVLAGYALGIAWAGLVYTLAERFFPREQNESSAKPDDADSVAGLRAPGLFKQLPLVAILLILFGSLSFAGLSFTLLRHGALLQTDQSLYERLITAAHHASPTINELMLFGFFVGKQVILVLITLLIIYFVYKRFWRELAMLLVSSAGGSFVWDFFVNYFARPRPAEQVGLEVHTVPSFPSGHAMSAMIFYGFLAYLLIPKMPSLVWKWVLGIFALLVILFDGFSRMFQGSHYLTDVLAGYALGLAWAVLVYTIIENIFWRRKA